MVLEPRAERITWIDLEVELDEDKTAAKGGKPQWRWRPQHAPLRGRWRGEAAIHPLECYVQQGEVLYLPALWCVCVVGCVMVVGVGLSG